MRVPRVYARYAGLGIQMAIIMVLFAFGGHQLDAWLANETPYGLIFGALLGILVAMGYLIRVTYREDPGRGSRKGRSGGKGSTDKGR